MIPNGSRFHFSKLSENEKVLYNQICDALEKFETKLSISSGIVKASVADITKIVEFVLYDNPGFFYFDKSHFLITKSHKNTLINFQYDYSKTDTKKLTDEIERKIEKFIQHKIDPKMSKLAKQLVIYKYLQTTIKPDYKNISIDSYSIVGAFVNGACVCEGFAKAYKLLCDYLKLPSMLVNGESFRDGKKEAHAWNITRINGVAAHNDITWDTIAGVGSYDYFNLCNAEILTDHTFDTAFYPNCVSNKINYFYANNLIALNLDDVKRIIGSNVDKDYYSIKLLFPVVFEQIEQFGFPSGSWQYNKTQQVIKFIKS